MISCWHGELDPATGKPDPGRMSAFLAKHPESAKALQLIHSHPVSSGFENSTFNSLNAFRFINATGAVVPVRWSMVPAQPFKPIATADAGEADKNYLFDALIASIHKPSAAMASGHHRRSAGRSDQ